MSEPQEQDVYINVKALYGRCEVRAWFEYDGDKLIGMGSKKTYDKDGNLVDCNESPTGLTMVLS